MTADGVVVVSHDPALSPAITRDADGQWLNGPGPLIRHLTFDALRSFDVGRIRPASAYRLRQRAQKGCDGARVPALADVLRRFPRAMFIIELKTDPRHPGHTVDASTLARAVLADVDAAGAADRVIVESFDWRGPIHVRRTRPEIRLAWLTRDETVRDAGSVVGRRRRRRISETRSPPRSPPKWARVLGTSGRRLAETLTRASVSRRLMRSAFGWSHGPSTAARRCGG